METENKELNIDRLDQVRGGTHPGYWPASRSHLRHSNELDAARYLLPNKNNDVRSSELTFL